MRQGKELSLLTSGPHSEHTPSGSQQTQHRTCRRGRNEGGVRRERGEEGGEEV